MSEEKNREEQIRELMEELEIDEVLANFMIALENGEIDGDLIMVDDDGNEVRPPPRAADNPSLRP